MSHLFDMSSLPDIVKRPNLTYYWWYRDASNSASFALVARYDAADKKKWFHQYQLINGEWTEGAATPLPIFGLHSLQNHNHEETVFIFEGEKSAQAAHHLDLIALTSMMGSANAEKADWAILAGYREYKHFVLIPDHDEPGKKYMRTVYGEIRKFNPLASIKVCPLPLKEKGDDLIDWIKDQEFCPKEWNGFGPIDEPSSLYLKKAFEEAVEQYSIAAAEYFAEAIPIKPTFGPFEPLTDSVFPLKKCPIDTFPDDVKEWLERLADQMQVPIDYLATPLLIYVGATIGRKRGIRVRKETGWIEFPNLWGMLIGRPSLMKSPSMKAVRKPLDFLMIESKYQYDIAIKQYKVKKEAWDLLKKAKEENMKKSFKEKLSHNHVIDLEQFVNEDLAQEPYLPKHKRYKTDDITVEKLGELLIENPQGLLLFRDELSGWLYSFEKSGRENDRPFFLESWSGKEDFNIDRIGRGSLYIPALCLSILGSIQPGPLAHYVHDALQGGKGDDGFLQRFQLMIWPEENGNWELTKVVPLTRLEERMKELFLSLDQLSFDPDSKPIFIEFEPEAQSLFDGWQTRLENRLRSGNLPSYMEAHLTKYKKLVPALSLIFHYLLGQKAQQGRISKKELECAIIWAEYLESHAEKVYHSGTQAVQKSALNLIRRVQKGDIKEPFSARDVYQGHHWSGLANPNEVEEVIALLLESGYLAHHMVKTPGRSSMKYWVHPDIFTHTQERAGPKGPKASSEPFEPDTI